MPACGRIDEHLTPEFGYFLDGAELVVRERSAFQEVEILRSSAFGAMLRIDGSLQCSERDEFFYHEPIVHDAMVRLAGPVRALVIGGGDGGAAEELLKWPNVTAVEHVEIDALVLALAAEHLHGVHLGVLAGRDARYRAHVADGAAWVQCLAPASVEVIVLDLTDCGGPSSPLYAPAFYAACRRALAPAGVMTLHLAAPFMQLATCVRLHANLLRAFPFVDPLLTSITMSGGQWLMAACYVDAAAALPPPARCQERLATLHGPALQLVSAETLHAMHALPPYLRAALGAAA